MTHHGTLTADYRKAALAVNMACVCVCVCLPTKDLFSAGKRPRASLPARPLVSYSFSLAHNNNCMST